VSKREREKAEDGDQRDVVASGGSGCEEGVSKKDGASKRERETAEDADQRDVVASGGDREMLSRPTSRSEWSEWSE
jgi:hypothetical protein